MTFNLFEEVYDNVHGAKFWGDMAAGILPVCPSTQRMLVSHRSRNVNEPSTWGIFGGKLDPEDKGNIEQAARRELEEETGYKGRYHLVPAYVYKSGDVFTYHNFIVKVNKEFQPRLDWESQGYRWISKSELKKLEPKHFGLIALLNNSMNLIDKYLK